MGFTPSRLVSHCLLGVFGFAAPAFAQGELVNFESPQVHPIALSTDGTRLLVVNTPDARLSVFDLSQPSNPLLVAEIPVGIEPVTVRPRTSDEVWVVNHTSDSVSVVSLSQGIVTDTIVVKDEPGDVVFAGSPVRAYVSASRSNVVRVYDVTTHALITSISLMGTHPRALAVSNDGLKVYAAFAQSGNRTTIIPAAIAPPQPPPTNGALPAPPQVGLIVDATDPAWAPSVIKYTMPDNDVAEINTATNTVARYFPRVGTSNFAVAVRPTNGDLFVANTDARNLVRFEPNVRGHVVDNQVSRITIGPGTVTKFDLNAGLNYALLPNPAAVATALAQPTDLAFTSDGATLYVAAFGTDRIGVLDASGNVVTRIDIGNVTGSQVDPRTKRGSRGLALKESVSRLYVANRLTNTVTVVNTATNTRANEVPIGRHDPTPDVIRQGRGFLYDAKLSGNGTMACAACHVDADVDMLAWDLGDPGGSMATVPDPTGFFGPFTFHPMKGPMTTQTLKGLTADTTPFHWRGDRGDFTAFNPAFDSLLGGAPLAELDMVAYRDFIETIAYEPNPNQNLDRTLPTSFAGGNPQTGQTTFTTNQYQSLLTCNTCHTLPTGQFTAIIPASALQESQAFNVPQLRNMYQKVNFITTPGQQSRDGFGFLHDGQFPTLQSFLSQPVFGNVSGNTTFKNNLNAFLQCFDTGMAPAVGYSRSVRQSNANQAAVTNDVTLLQNQAAAGNIDLILKGRIDGVLRGYRYVPGSGTYSPDTTSLGALAWSALQSKALAGNATFTLMGVPFGSGVRMGVDRDVDGILDGDEPSETIASSYGNPSPPCAGPITMGVNSMPYIGNSVFALTCANTPPASTSLALIANQRDLLGSQFYGFTLWLDLVTSTELFTLDLISDASGFAIGASPIPNNPALIGAHYYGETLSIFPCAPYTVAGSQGIELVVVSP